MEERTMAFRVDEELHRTLKVKLAAEGITLKDYVIGLIKSDLYLQKRPIPVDKLKVYAEEIHRRSGQILEMIARQPAPSENNSEG
ncbi:MAG: hypothetical protein IJS71_09965 [Clostridia bacterium]|nr:hypothetical protein [Clostridia bacterium]